MDQNVHVRYVFTLYEQDHICVMIRVNCVRFNMTAADAQNAQLGIGGLWAWYTLELNIWVISGHLQGPWVLTCHLVVWPNFDSCLQVMVCCVEIWVLFSSKLSVK